LLTGPACRETPPVPQDLRSKGRPLGVRESTGGPPRSGMRRGCPTVGGPPCVARVSNPCLHWCGCGCPTLCGTGFQAVSSLVRVPHLVWYGFPTRVFTGAGAPPCVVRVSNPCLHWCGCGCPTASAVGESNRAAAIAEVRHRGGIDPPRLKPGPPNPYATSSTPAQPRGLTRDTRQSVAARPAAAPRRASRGAACGSESRAPCGDPPR
jgi:hypothetical protein